MREDTSKKKFLILRANKTFFVYVFKYGKLLVLFQIVSILFSSLVSYVGVMAPKMFLDHVVENRELYVGLTWIAVMIVVNTIHSLMISAINTYKTSVYEKAKLESKKVCIRKLFKFNLSYFDNPEKMNAMQRALNYNESGGVATLDSIVSILSLLSSFTTLSVVSLAFDWWLWLAIITLFIYKILTVPIHRNSYFIFENEKVPRMRRISYLSGVLMGSNCISDMKLFGGLDFFTKKYESEVLNNLHINRKFELKMQLKTLLLSLPNKLFDLFLYVVIGIKLIAQEVTIGDYALFFSMVASINGILNSISMTYSSISAQEQNAQLLYDFLNDQTDVICLPQNPIPISDIYTVELKNVSFIYPDQNQPALDNISLKINKGDKISIIGFNGAGKSTLVKLLLLLNKQSSGDILINGYSSEQIDCYEYWNKCSVLLQQHNEYSISVGENVLLDNVLPEDQNKVWSALEKAGLKSKVESFDEKLDTPFTRLFYESGVEFSGGERQRLSIARMFAKNADLIIMDEPSSALDPTYEDELNKHIKSIPSDKTVIVISHRLSSIKVCNRVVFMSEGRIVADGSHEKVYNTCSAYRDMFDMQLDKYSIGLECETGKTAVIQ